MKQRSAQPPGHQAPGDTLGDDPVVGTRYPSRLTTSTKPAYASKMGIDVPYLGHGIGLRQPHVGAFLATSPRCAWLEVISENFMVAGGRPRFVLDQLRRDYPVVLHGVSLSIGGSDPLDRAYLAALRTLSARYDPAWISDHLCWGSYGGHYAHDLLPLPYTEEAVAHVVARVRAVQDALGRQILLENVSSYVAYRASTLTEWEFLTAVVEQADCGILLDVNNLYVSAHNHGFAPHAYLHGIPAARVGQLHLAGHSDKGAYVLDTHDGPVSEAVWQLYGDAIRHLGPVSTLIEWDEHLPSLDVLLAEADKAAQRAADALERVA